MGVPQAWARILRWLDEYAPATAAPLLPAASLRDVLTLERIVGIGLPADLHVWWSVCGGVTTNAEHPVFAEVFPPFYTPYTPADSLRSWQTWRERVEDGPSADPEAGAKAAVWDPAFVPFGFDGCGGDLVVDLRPGESHGCLLEFDHERGAVYGPAWPGVADMLVQIAGSLEDRTAVGHYHPNHTTAGRLDWHVR